jgi:hypothetical protein
MTLMIGTERFMASYLSRVSCCHPKAGEAWKDGLQMTKPE